MQPDNYIARDNKLKSHQSVQFDSLVGCCPILILSGMLSNPKVYIIEQFLHTAPPSKMNLVV